MRLKQALIHGLQAMQIKSTAAMQAALLAYLENLVKWNQAYNLTAIKTPEQMLVYHIFDSLSVHSYLNADKILDVGSGAGLPGIPLAIINPDKRFALLDSHGKKIHFLLQLRHTLALQNVDIIHTRVEEHVATTCFPIVITRAFAAIAEFIAKTQHLCCQEGRFFCMKGKRPDAEIAALKPDYPHIDSYRLQIPRLNAERSLVVVRNR